MPTLIDVCAPLVACEYDVSQRRVVRLHAHLLYVTCAQKNGHRNAPQPIPGVPKLSAFALKLSVGPVPGNRQVLLRHQGCAGAQEREVRFPRRTQSARERRRVLPALPEGGGAVTGRSSVERLTAVTDRSATGISEESGH